MNKYLLLEKLTAKRGKRDELGAILINASKLVSATKGCRLYAIAIDNNDMDTVFITEIWDNKEDHDNALKAASVKESIMKAIPFLEGHPTKGQELEVLGGLGI